MFLMNKFDECFQRTNVQWGAFLRYLQNIHLTEPKVVKHDPKLTYSHKVSGAVS